MYQDLAGRRFGRLVVVSHHSADKWGSQRWLCKCDCGKEKVVVSGHLKNGNTRSCGCYRVDTGKAKVKDLIGETFGRLKVVSRDGNDDFGHAKWLCECSCGNVVSVLGDNLSRNNHTTSCGCAKIDAITKHGLVAHPIYAVWASMKNRCSITSMQSSERYSGRGIKVCDEWKDDFISFYEWAKDKYKEGLQIDRIDNDGDYEPNNCRFVDASTNNANKNITDKNTTGYLGVRLRFGWWIVRVTFRGVETTLPTHFATAEQAAKARDEFIIANNLPHRLNFPLPKLL